MTTPVQEPRRVPPYVALVRILAVIAMSTAAASGILLMIAEAWLLALIAFAVAVPFFAVMRLAERTAEPPEPPPAL